jgi:LysM repeat protein
MREPKIRLRKRPERTGVLRKLRANTQSATIHLTHEDDWETEVPNVKLSRVFAIVLLLHVVAVGGILAFQMLNPEEGAPARAHGTVANVSMKGRTGETGEVLSGADSITGNLNKGLSLTDERVRGLRHYRVQSGDTLDAIARDFDVEVTELEQLNGLNKGNKLYTGLILYIPNRKITAAPSDEVQRLSDGRESRMADPQNQGARPGERMAAKLVDRLNGGALAPAAATPAQAPAPAAAAPDVAVALDDPNAVIGTLGSLENPPAPAPPTAARTKPKAAPPKAERPATPRATPDAETAKKVRDVVKFYTVQKGDTAYALGRKFGIKHEELLRINGIADARQLRIGQKIKVPVKP